MKKIEWFSNKVRKKIYEDFDMTSIIFGKKRTGKSTLAQIIAKFIDKDFDVEKQVVFHDEDIYPALYEVKRRGVIILDEGAATGLLKGRHNSKESKKLKEVIAIAGRKNLVLLILAPSLQLLQKRFIQDEYLINCIIEIRKRGVMALYDEVQKIEWTDEGNPILPDPMFLDYFDKLNDEDWRKYEKIKKNFVQNKIKERMDERPKEDEEEKAGRKKLKVELEEIITNMLLEGIPYTRIKQLTGAKMTYIRKIKSLMPEDKKEIVNDRQQKAKSKILTKLLNKEKQTSQPKKKKSKPKHKKK